MKKLLLALLLLPLLSLAQVRQSQFDSAMQRQSLLNQGFGTNINTLLSNNGDRRRQIESLQRDSIVKTAQIASLKADSANKALQIRNLQDKYVSLESRIKAIEEDSVSLKGLLYSNKVLSVDTVMLNKMYAVKAAEPIIITIALAVDSLNKKLNTAQTKFESSIKNVESKIIDTVVLNKIYATKQVEPIITQLIAACNTLNTRTTTVEGKLESIAGKVLILEAFKEAIKKL